MLKSHKSGWFSFKETPDNLKWIVYILVLKKLCDEIPELQLQVLFLVFLGGFPLSFKQPTCFRFTRPESLLINLIILLCVLKIVQ